MVGDPLQSVVIFSVRPVFRVAFVVENFEADPGFEVGASAAVDDQEGHGFELARVVAREVLGVDRDLETAKVYCGFVGDVEAVHGFVHRGVELAGVDLVQVDVRQLDAIEAGVRLADRSYVAELGEEHRDGTLSDGIVMGLDGYRDVDRDVDRLRVWVWEVAWPVALQVSLGCRSVGWRLVWRCGRQGARHGGERASQPGVAGASSTSTHLQKLLSALPLVQR